MKKWDELSKEKQEELKDRARKIGLEERARIANLKEETRINRKAVE